MTAVIITEFKEDWPFLMPFIVWNKFLRNLR